MYTLQADRPINPVIRDILRVVHGIAAGLGHRCLLVGATARDVMMFHVFANESKRATYDVDLAVAVPDWDSFKVLQDALVGTGDFALSQDTGHLLHYRPAEHGRAYPLDLIPFGGVETLPTDCLATGHERRHECDRVCRSA